MANNVQIDITAKDNASAAINKITGSLSKLGAIAGAAIVAGATALISFTGASIAAAARVDELAIVNQVLAKNAGLTGKSVTDAAAAVKKMGIEADVSQKTVAKFVQNNLDLSKASEVARVAQDAAVISGQNSTQALDGLTQGLITLQPEVLRTYGLFVDTAVAYEKFAKANKLVKDKLTTQQKQQALLNAVLEKGKDIAGAYEAAMTSASKQIRSWPRYINDLMVAFGTPFQAAFSKSAIAVSSLLKKLAPMFEKGGEFYYLTRQMAMGAEVLADNFAKFLDGIDWKAVATNIESAVLKFRELLNMNFPELAATFAKAFDDIDFGKISDGLVKSINNINWAEMGRQMRSGLEVLNKSLGDAFNEIKWGELGKSAATGAMNIIAGFTNQGSWDQVKSTWAFNSASLLNLIQVWGARWKAAIPKLAVEVFFPGPGVWAKAAAQIAAGMELIAAAFGAGGGAGGFSPNINGAASRGHGPGPTTQARTSVLAGGRAAGGPVSADTSYLVGEKGPEIFTPGTRGKIIPNGMMGGVTINLTYAPAFSTASQSEFEKAITPMLNNWYRSRLTS